MTTILVIFVLIRQGNIIYALNKLLTGKYHLHKNICIEHQNIYKNKHILALYVYDNSFEYLYDFRLVYIVKLKKFSLKYFIFVYTLFFMVFPHIAISLKFCDSRLPLKFFIALSILKFAEFAFKILWQCLYYSRKVSSHDPPPDTALKRDWDKSEGQVFDRH